MKFKEMALAHELCTGKGIEFGRASHNPFGLSDCINIAPDYDEAFYKTAQISLCGEAAKIDIYGTAVNVPVESNAYDYVISSHVVEHICNIIKAFKEWNRILKPGGIIFMIFPKREADPNDVGRPLSTIEEFETAYTENHPEKNLDRHVWVFSLASMIDLINFCNDKYDLGWKIIATEETDSKVGNGHTVVCRRK